jgi:hypothetical protein
MLHDAQVIRRCINECVAAPSGHGRRWAVARCQSVLSQAGADPAVAQAAAHAARSTADALRASAQRVAADVSARFRP